MQLKRSGIKVPIIMYHSILKSQKGDYIVSPTILENDLLYIKEKGYTTITVSDLINYVYNDVSLPGKAIMITFDDGHYNNYGYAVPLLKKYNMKAVISIVGKYTDTFSETNETNLNYSYLRWVDVKELIEDGTIEFQNHSYNLHDNSHGRKGSMKKYNETIENYQALLSEDLMKLQEKFKEKTNYLPTTYTYPYGAVSKDSIKIIKELGFKASFSCSSGINYITKDIDCLYMLKRNNRTSNANREKFFSKLLD